MSTQYVIETRVGRLIEARVHRLLGRAEADDYSEALRREVQRLGAGVQPVLCADHRPVGIYSQPAADRLAELFTHMNSRLERVAILVSPSNATLGMQLDRIVREVKNERRKAYRETDAALRHLAESLDEPELTRARAFLAAWSPTDG